MKPLGTYWGEHGWFKLAKGINNLGIEDSCAFGVPTNDGYPKMKTVVIEDLDVTSESTVDPVKAACRESRVKFEGGPVITSPLPHEIVEEQGITLPTNWDWRNVDGKSYVVGLGFQYTTDCLTQLNDIF